MAEHTFTVNTDNHVAKIPGIGDFEFEPEAYADELLDARAKLTRAQAALRAVKTADPDAPTEGELAQIVETTKGLHAEIRGFIAGLMVPESRERFADVKLPDRTLIELQNWILEQYGLRPTGPSSVSSEPSATTSKSGEGSMGGSVSEGSTP